MAICNLLLAMMVTVMAVSPGAAAAQAPAASAASVPPLEPVARALPNGARIYSLRDPTSAVVSVHAFYLVGQRDDPRGRGGFAHLFEHLMFRTTRNLPDGVSAFITSIGGQTNASTVFDQTPYWAR